LANATIKHAGRLIDFLHMPVPRDRSDDAYFAPLAELDIRDAKLYLGLVHVTGGIEPNLKRIETAKRYASNFSVATECGFGRRPPERMSELVEIHRTVADALA